MSTTVDSRVVEMRFDNKQFESNVATSMSTLDKLKQKLQFDGATKGLDDVSRAAGKVDMSGLGNAVETVSTKFSALQVVGVTALANITNSAINAGKKLAKSLSVDQITAGWDKYDKKTANVQTLVNATGLSIDEVNSYLEKLMWFSDETSYAFTDMTAGLATMVSSGGDIKKLVPLLMGVANATAFAGKGAAEFSRVLQYGVNQAYSLGYMQVQDWKTIEGATVNSKQLMETLIAAGEALGTIKKGEIDTGKFRSSLKDQWLTKDVMELGFGRFAEMSEKAYEMVQSGEVDTASEAYEKLSEQYDTISLTAAKAAQEAKTFTEAIDATKDAVSSGWMKSFELIFGNYEQAKRLWTDLANTLWDVFASGAEVRNWVLEGATNFAKPWKAIEEKLSGITNVADKIKNVTKSLEEYQKIVRKVWRGDYGNKSNGRYSKLEKAGYNPRVVQKLVNLGAKHKLTIEDVEAAEKKYGLTVEATAEETEKAADALNNLTDEKLKDLGLTEDEIELYRALEEEAERTGKSVSKLAEEMSEVDGRTLLIDSFKNLGSILLDTLTTVKSAFAEIFNPPSAAEMVIKLYNLIKKFNEFTESIRLTNKETGELTETGKKLSDIVKGIFAAIDIVLTILKGPFKFVFDVVTKIFKIFGVTVLDVLAGIGRAIVKFRDGVDKVVDTVSTFIAEHVTKWIDKFKETEFFKTVAQWFKDASDTISESVDNISTKVDNFNTSGFMKRLKTLSSFLTDIAKTIKNSKIFGVISNGITTAFSNIKKFFSNFKLPEFSLENIQSSFAKLTNLGDSMIGAKGGGIGGMFTALESWASTNVNWYKNLSLKIKNFPATALEWFSKFWIKTSDLIKKAFEKGKEVATAIVEFLFGTSKIDLPTIMDAVEKFLTIALLIKAIGLLDTIVSPLDNITDALNNFATSLKWNAISGAFKSLALALAALTVCIVVLTSMDMKKAWSAAGMLMALMAVMGGIVIAMGIIAGKSKTGLDTAGAAMSLLMLVGSIAILVYTIKELDKLELKNPAQTFTSLGVILLALTVGMRMIAKAGGSSFKSIAAVLTLMAALKMLLDVITAYDEYDWTGKGKAIQKVMEMLLGLSVAMRIASGSAGSGNGKGMALMLLGMILSLKLMLGIIEEFADMDEERYLKGITMAGIILAGFTLMTKYLAKANKTTKLKDGEKAVNNFKGLAVALLAVVAAVWLLGKMDPETLIQGGIAVASALLLFAYVMSSIGKASKGIKTFNIILMIVGVIAILGVIAHLIKVLKDIPVERTIGAAGALAGMLFALLGVMKAIGSFDMRSYSNKKLTKIALMFAGLVVIMALLGAVLWGMSALDVNNAIPNAIALSALLIVLTGVLKTLGTIKYSKDIYKSMLALAVLSLVVLELGAILWCIKKLDITGMESEVVTLSALLLVLTGVMAACAAMGKVVGPNITGIAACVGAIAILGAVVLELGYFLSLIKPMGIGGMLPEVLVLSTLLVVLTGVMAACAAIGIIASANIAGLAVTVTAIAILGAVVLELGYFLSLIKQWDIGGMMPEVTVLSALLIVLTGVVAACSVIGLLAGANMVGLGVAILAIAILGAVVLELGFFLSLIKKWDIGGMQPEVQMLTNLMFDLADMLGILTILGIGAPLAISGIGALVTMVLALEGLILALGAVMSIPGLSKFMDTGIETLKKLAGGIGEAIGAFGVGLTSDLPKIGENLSGFATNLDGFITAMSKVDGNLVTNAKNLMTAISTLTKADFLDGINNLFSKKDKVSSLEKLGTQLSGFADNASTFMSSMAGMDTTAASNMESFTNAIGALNVVLGNNNFTEGALEKFGTSIASFAESMKEVAGSLSDLTEDDVAHIKLAADAAKHLAKLNDAIPKSGGVWQDIAGEADLADWGTKISAFADSLVAYSDKVSGKNIDKEAILTSAEAATAISDLNAGIPKADGVWQDIAGSQDLAAWGTKISAFAESLVAYSTKVSGKNIDKEAILKSADAASALAEVNEAIPKSGGAWQSIAGEADLTTYGAGLVAFADGLVAYANAATQIDDTKIEAIKNTGKAVDEIKLVVEKVPKIGFDWGNGVNDPNAFGTGIKALADGIKAYCTVAATITQEDIDAIGFTKNAITALSEVANNIPEDPGTEKALMLKTVADNIRNVCGTINSFTTAGYDFSGIATVKTGITNLMSVLPTAETMEGASARANSLKITTAGVLTCASGIQALNDYTYGGVDIFKGAIKSLSEVKMDTLIANFSGKDEAIKEALTSVANAISTNFVDGIVSESTVGKYKEAGKGVVNNFVLGLAEKKPTAKKAGGEVADEAVAGLDGVKSGAKTAGKDLVQGFANGITSNTYIATAKAKAMAEAAIETARAALKINSPSKVFKAIGSGIPEGFAMGIGMLGGNVKRATIGMTDTAVSATSDAIARISSVLNADMDVQPVISPVLDLSNVRSGAAAMSGMLDMNSSVGVLANVNGINRSMNARSQNGANADVVSELAKLRKDIGNMSNTTYQVNGITYDDGSNITTAVADLVRAARIERRV